MRPELVLSLFLYLTLVIGIYIKFYLLGLRGKILLQFLVGLIGRIYLKEKANSDKSKNISKNIIPDLVNSINMCIV